jgi:hypothetical protein
MILHLANIAFVRDDAPEQYKWKRVGSLWYDPEPPTARIMLTAFRFGLCAARPFDQQTAPYLQGEIWTHLHDGGRQFVGLITTSDLSGILYSIKFECYPIHNTGNAFYVSLDSAPGYVPMEEP